MLSGRPRPQGVPGQADRVLEDVRDLDAGHRVRHVVRRQAGGRHCGGCPDLRVLVVQAGTERLQHPGTRVATVGTHPPQHLAAVLGRHHREQRRPARVRLAVGLPAVEVGHGEHRQLCRHVLRHLPHQRLGMRGRELAHLTQQRQPDQGPHPEQSSDDRLDVRVCEQSGEIGSVELRQPAERGQRVRAAAGHQRPQRHRRQVLVVQRSAGRVPVGHPLRLARHQGQLLGLVGPLPPEAHQVVAQGGVRPRGIGQQAEDRRSVSCGRPCHSFVRSASG